MEVFKGVATSCTATGPLKNDSEVGIGRSDIDNLTNAIDGTCFEETGEGRIDMNFAIAKVKT